MRTRRRRDPSKEDRVSQDGQLEPQPTSRYRLERGAKVSGVSCVKSLQSVINQRTVAVFVKPSMTEYSYEPLTQSQTDQCKDAVQKITDSEAYTVLIVIASIVTGLTALSLLRTFWSSYSGSYTWYCGGGNKPSDRWSRSLHFLLNAIGLVCWFIVLVRTTNDLPADCIHDYQPGILMVHIVLIWFLCVLGRSCCRVANHDGDDGETKQCCDTSQGCAYIWCNCFACYHGCIHPTKFNGIASEVKEQLVVEVPPLLEMPR